MPRPLLRASTLLLCGFLCGMVAEAGDSLAAAAHSTPPEEATASADEFQKDELLTGDWFGVRDRLFHSGVELSVYYTSILAGNVRGGLDSGHVTYVDDTFVGLTLDLEKLIGWKGGQIVVSGVNRNGDDLTGEYIGSLFSTQQVVGGKGLFLYQIYLQQKLFRDQLTAKLGRFGAADDFNTSPLYGFSLNDGINGNLRNVSFNTPFSTYPFASWGGALFYDPIPEFGAKLGIFQVSRGEFVDEDHGMNLGIGHDDGFVLVGQVGWAPQFFRKPVAADKTIGKETVPPKMEGLPGHYWVGATFCNWNGFERFTGTGHRDQSYGFYAHADQMIFQEKAGSDEGLTAWAAAGYYPQEDISGLPFQLDLGLNYKGLLPCRGEDHTVLHFIYGDLSRDYAESIRVVGGRRAHSEKVLELGYRYQVAAWGYVQPDVQYVIDPGGTGDIPNAVVLGMQMGITF